MYSDPKNDGQLSKINDFVIIRIERAKTQIAINLYPQSNQCNPDIKLKITQLDNDTSKTNKLINRLSNIVQQQPLSPPIIKQQTKPQAIKTILNGHIEWQGDVQTKNNQWLGDPQSQSRLEGFNLQIPEKPEGIEVLYNAAVNNMGESKFVPSGNYVGTSKKALAINAVGFELIGQNAKQYDLIVHIAFSETGTRKIVIQQRSQISGMHQGEFLTAIKVELIPKIKQMLPEINTETTVTKQKKQENQWDDMDDILVFRS